MKLKLILILIFYIFNGCSISAKKLKSPENCDKSSAKPYSLNALKNKYQCESDKGIVQ